MRIIKRLLFSLLALIVLLGLAGFLLPARTEIERSTQILASPSETFSFVNHLPSSEKWDPWFEMEPTARRTYSDPPSGKGANYSWVGEETGKGKMTLNEVVPNERIDATVAFEGQGEADIVYRFEPLSNGGTEVKWAFGMNHGYNVLSRWIGIMMEGAMAKDFDKGLANLKTVAEQYHQTASAQENQKVATQTISLGK